ncbi:MAG: hypothetical protein GAK31_03103 [Stenotrophomonas maltophilia]|uniref:Helicase n=1 Tax=Stenotrophomonas maltophilia TaxID=40324 RepID=A0A7V8FEV7_STEMA|nr:MAG: hypothetical protein GAK31_03103 [Stenotrophomonas maltophilia]
MPAPFDQDDLFRWFDPKTLARAGGCLERVGNLRADGDVLHADVRGTARRPYHVAINLAASTGSARGRLHGSCSCPVGSACKHMAAVMLLVLGISEREGERSSTTDTRTSPPRTELLDHLSQWHAQQAMRSARPGGRSSTRGIVFELSVLDFKLMVVAYRTQQQKDGTVSDDKALPITPELFLEPPGYLSQQDIAVLCQLWLRHDAHGPGRIEAGPLLEMIVASGHGWVRAPNGSGRQPARLGPLRQARLEWTQVDGPLGRLPAPALQVDGGADGVVEGRSACYLDADSGEVGLLGLPVPIEDAAAFLALPPLLPSERALTGQMLQQLDPALPRLQASEAPLPVAAVDGMVPHLMLHTEYVRPAWMGRRESAHVIEFATVAFEYGDHFKHLEDDSRFVRDADGAISLLPRDTAKEARRETELLASHLHRNPHPEVSVAGVGPIFQLRSYDWGSFMLHQLPRLQALGWAITVPDDFRHQVTAVETFLWDVQPDSQAPGWLDLALDIEVDGRTLPLAPMLQQLLASDPRWTRGPLDAIPDDERILVAAPGVGALSFQAGRLKPVITLLGDLFGPRDERLRVSARDSGRLQALQEHGRLQPHGQGDAHALVQRLLHGPALAPAAAPVGLAANLRPYQRDGLGWLQYLRQHDLGGVLADDMGLGKTLQTLAHVLLEKEQGRLDRPALVVMPTSLLHNWQDEAARFTPGLRVLALHGAGREALFAQIPQHDLVLTTYPLVWRDAAALQAHAYHLLILDEAQQVKNAKARAAIALRGLQSRHRLCLTGTPLENHLGELWTHLDFLLPGLLGSEKVFNQHWRHPIERGGDSQRAQLLAQRVRPFILRRRKDQVVTELPPKTTITRHVLLEGGQRDLYETVRVAMEEKVREAVASNGLAKSHIVVLDALLKLRQVCCDPRLLPDDTAVRTQGSAKLELLLSLLPEMVEEGRRILLFSQFTSMLSLIGQALDGIGLPYVTLTGDTRDRATPVRRFMQGEVPVFLISLKAGGVGLNLTAADTVIHFDPWWNPAAENQASDRAYRIGQDKPVFVYKLIATGSIEERIAELQQRKAALADSILDNTGSAAGAFSEDDLQALLASLPGAPAKKAARRRRPAAG